MKIGNEWIYLVKWYDQNGTLTSTFNIPYRISRTETRNGITYFSGMELYRNLDINTVEVFRSSGKVEIYLKRVTTNASVIYSDTLGFIDTTVHKLIGYTDLININGHNCIKNEEVYMTSGRVSEKKIFFVAPGLGLVRIDSYYDSSHLRERQDLISYTLK